MANTKKFYNDLAPLYHLIYSDWEKSIKRQGEMLHSIIREMWEGASDILDVSCGIGTQTLGLSSLGYNVTASDLSSSEVDRAKKEAAERNLSIAFSVADMRCSFEHHQRQFDVVISCDNSVPHLLSDEDIFTAFQQFYESIRPGGGCIISVRDYEKEDFTQQQAKFYGIREVEGTRWLIWQVWDPHPPMYDVTFYFVEDRGGSEVRTHMMRSKYYAVSIPSLIEMMNDARFDDVLRMDDRFFQPIIVGTKRHNQKILPTQKAGG